MTEVIYVCSQDRRRQLEYSLSSLVQSGTSFDQVTVYVVGPERWTFDDKRIRAEGVAPLFGSYFHGNKVYLCQSQADRVVFLDTDTFILRPLDDLWVRRKADVLARPASAWAGRNWDARVWADTFEALGLDQVAMFNAGLLVFQNGAHRKVEKAWHHFIVQYVGRRLPFPYADERMPEQFGLSLAIQTCGLSLAHLNGLEHCYGWIPESWQGVRLLHTGNVHFEKYARAVGVGVTLRVRDDRSA